MVFGVKVFRRYLSSQAYFGAPDRNAASIWLYVVLATGPGFDQRFSWVQFQTRPEIRTTHILVGCYLDRT